MTQRSDSLGDEIEAVRNFVQGTPCVEYRIRGITVVRLVGDEPPMVQVLLDVVRSKTELMRLAAVLLFAADRMDQANFARHACGNPKRTGVMEGERGSILA